MTETFQGSCFCGAVQLEVAGDAAFQGFCHCDDCRRWSGTPVTAFALWPSDKVRVTAGEDRLVSYSQTGSAERKHCATCGGSIMTETPSAGLTDVYPMILDGYAFAPAFHVYYGLRVIDLPDGLPKYRDMPDNAGGSGEMIED